MHANALPPEPKPTPHQPLPLRPSFNNAGVGIRGSDPRGLSRLVRGELDWIVMKALEKDRTRRYEIANGFVVAAGAITFNSCGSSSGRTLDVGGSGCWQRASDKYELRRDFIVENS